MTLAVDDAKAPGDDEATDRFIVAALVQANAHRQGDTLTTRSNTTVCRAWIYCGTASTRTAVISRSSTRSTTPTPKACGASSSSVPTPMREASSAAARCTGASSVATRGRCLKSFSSIICEAAADGNTVGVGTLLDAGFDPDARGRVWREGPIHRAAIDGHFDTVELLHERDADLTMRDACYHASPLGAHGGRLELVDLLLVRGADPGLANSEGTTALDYAVQQGNKNVADLIRRTLEEGLAGDRG